MNPLLRKMTIQKLLNGEKINVLHVNIIEEISTTQFVVGDSTGIVIMQIKEDSSHQKQIEIGKGLKIMKPQKIKDNVIGCNEKFSPMKMKPITMTVEHGRVQEMVNAAKELNPTSAGIEFDAIINDYGQNAVIDNILAYVTTVSRTIDGAYGSYQICNLKDCNGDSLSLNLYKTNVDKLEPNKIYRIEKIKKTTIKSDSGVRMGTTNHTKIRSATKAETDLFKDTMIADKRIEGLCVMFNELSYYMVCPKHNKKVDEIGCCNVCGELEPDSTKPDFRCQLMIEAEIDKIIPVNIFRRHLDIKVDKNDEEETVVDKIEQVIVDKRCMIDYNENGDDNNTAIKVTVL